MFRLTIVTPQRVVYDEEVASVIAPGTLGYLGLLSNHAPIITSLKPGKLTIKNYAGKEIFVALSGGFLENSANVCTVLADAAEFASDIDVERARQSLERAKQRIHNAAGNIDIGRAQAAYERAKNRLRIVREK